ncbi:flagellar hook assembly protein FlgD [Sphingomonas sp. S1-29]|uniref:flagellar hook assembly protein FlgD n=1 Tax=Sphingomonas sp. S1-29 TaxID=2991074 RepID=UPI0022401762|nr:flagellar hook capping FlgD N-terminal domain-containing protein [Sphingomonas sp. S1-29]UZK68899.1 flagellar hook assembly protein FlgD [Sphingomonas sp. S1-29]
MASSFDSTLANLGIARSGATDPQLTTRSAQQTLDQGDFLSLMTAQLKNQDPFEPVDNTAMVAQMAQFSSLAGITEMSSTLKAIADKLGASGMTDAAALVGRTVLAEGNVAYGRTTGGLQGGIELAGDVSELSVAIKAADGTTLRTLDLGAQKAGTVTFDWDGKTETGAAAGDGPFTIVPTARNGGAAVNNKTLVWAPVSSVSLVAGEPVLTLPGIGQVKSSAIRSIG